MARSSKQTLVNFAFLCRSILGRNEVEPAKIPLLWFDFLETRKRTTVFYSRGSLLGGLPSCTFPSRKETLPAVAARKGGRSGVGGSESRRELYPWRRKAGS